MSGNLLITELQKARRVVVEDVAFWFCDRMTGGVWLPTRPGAASTETSSLRSFISESLWRPAFPIGFSDRPKRR